MGFCLQIKVLLGFLISFVCAEHPLLLLISLDGLNHKYVNENKTPNIWKLAQGGVLAAKGIKVQFTTVTASNHHSIVTGLYQESHGIIDNTFYDKNFNEHYDIWNFTGNTSRYYESRAQKWYQGGEPIWQTNMKIEGRLSGTYHWPMGDANISHCSSHKTTTWLDYNDTYIEWQSEIDKLLEWYTSDKDPINLGLYYHAQPDHIEHISDLNGENVTEILHQLDQLIGYLVDKTKQLKIFDKLNFILTADHGHAIVKDEAHVFTLKNYITDDLVINSSLSFFPREDKGVTAEDIYRNLTRAVRDGLPIQVWRKEDFPEKYHWKNNHRVGPVIFVANMHYQQNSKVPKTFPYGTHGYLNDYEEMNAFFVAFGPAFKKGYVISTDYIQNIDIYPLMCHILGVDPAPNNGSFDRISIILNANFGEYKLLEDSFVKWLLVLGIIVPFFALFFYLTVSCFNKSSSRVHSSVSSKNNYRKLETNANFDCNYETGGGNIAKLTKTNNNPGSSNGVKIGNKPLLQLEKEGSSDDEL